MEISLVVLVSPTDPLAAQLKDAGAEIHTVSSVEAACDLANRIASDAIVVRADAYDASSLSQLVKRFAPLPVLAAGPNDVNRIVTTIQAGARHYLALPFERADLDALIDVLFTESEDDQHEPEDVMRLLGPSKRMQVVQETIRHVAPTSATVLVTGETGTGKELVARALHQMSGRNGPFVKVHCAGLPEPLLESELFGYERGAFTGASNRRAGRVEIAENGTLFFDEIGELTQSVQVKLLRLLQDRQYERLGSSTPLETNARFVAATHRKLADMVKRGQFREDLFYRIEVLRVHVPALRHRREDIPELAARFCTMLGRTHGRPDITFSERALELVSEQLWPGNVRQLRNFVERLVVLTKANTIDADEVAFALEPENDFSTDPRGGGSKSLSLPSRTGPPVPLDDVLRAAERKAIEDALRFTKGNKVLAARHLGVSRANLFRKIAALGIKYEPK